MISVIITAWKEPKQIKRALNSIINQEWNKQVEKDSKLKQEIEIIIACPDKKTWKAAKQKANEHNFKRIKWVKDPQKGKPFGMNMAFKETKGDIIFLTDGDVFWGHDVITKMLKHFKDKKVGAVTGRPLATENKNNMMGYYANLLADAAHHKRTVTMTPKPVGKSIKFVSKDPRFFVLSGYVSAIRNLNIKVPEDCLIDDAYLSYEIFNKGYRIAYEPKAVAYVKYATDLKDWFRQKLRSVGGYVQLWKYGVIKENTKVRNFWKELEYFWFPIKYAFRNGSLIDKTKRLIWSLFLYPIRLWLWIRIYYERKIKKKGFEETWVRIESTK